jgi:hypothetical protein
VPAVAFVHVIGQVSTELLQLVGQVDSQFDKADLERRASPSQFEFVLRDHSSPRIARFGTGQNQLKVSIDQRPRIQELKFGSFSSHLGTKKVAGTISLTFNPRRPDTRAA